MVLVIEGSRFCSLFHLPGVSPRLPATSTSCRNGWALHMEGAGQSATWRSRVARSAVSSRIFWSISSALAWITSREMFGGVLVLAEHPTDSPSEKPADLPIAISLSCKSTSGGNCRRNPWREIEGNQSGFLVIAQRRGLHPTFAATSPISRNFMLDLKSA